MRIPARDFTGETLLRISRNQLIGSLDWNAFRSRGRRIPIEKSGRVFSNARRGFKAGGARTRQPRVDELRLRAGDLSSFRSKCGANQLGQLTNQQDVYGENRRHTENWESR